MRRVLIASVLVALAVAASAAAALRPHTMTLQQGDVRSRYLFDRGESGSFPIPETLPANRYGIVTMRYAVYRDTSPPYWRTIKSIVFVLRRPDEAQSLLGALAREAGGAGAPGRTQVVAIGAQGWIATTSRPSSTTLVAWRQGRIVGLVSCEKVDGGRPVALGLARKQAARIAAALR